MNKPTPKKMKAMYLRAQQVSQQETTEARNTLKKIRQWFLQVANGTRKPSPDTDQLFKMMCAERARHVMRAIDFVGADPSRISMSYFRRRRHDPTLEKTTPPIRTPLDDAIEGDVQRQNLLARHTTDEKVRLEHVEEGVADARNGTR